MIQEKESRFLLVTFTFLILFGVWFFSIKDAFSPFILSLIIIGFMIPFRQHKSIRVMIAMVFTIFMIWLFFYLHDIVSPFLTSFALAYLFDPVVDQLEKRKVSRSFSIVIIIAFILSSLVLLGLLIIPQFASEVQILTTSFPSYEAIRSAIQLNWLSFLANFGIDVDRLMQTIETESSGKINELIKYFSLSTQNITAGLSSLLTQLINLILIPFLTFYFLRDFDKNVALLRNKIPERHKTSAEKIYSRINNILSIYIRGKILSAFVISLIAWIALTILGIDFALLIGMTTGFLSLLPYIGPILAFGIGVLFGLLNADAAGSIFKIVIVIAVIQLLDMAIISPKMVGEKLGIHPILMIFSLFVFGKVLGMLGLIIALPATAILKVFVMEWYERNFLKQEFLKDDVDS